MSAFRELSTTASANTVMGGYNTAEGMARADVNDVLRWIGASGKQLSASVPVSVVEYGAVGDGTTDDTVALQQALATGKNVYIPDGLTFRFTSNLTISQNYQRFGGPGVLKPEGNCGVIVSGCTAVELDVTFESAAHTGIAVSVVNSNRVRIRRLYGTDVFSCLYVTKANTVTVDWLWATCRGYGIKWYGTTADRSDVFIIADSYLSVPTGQYGLDWDGNCHSLDIDSLGIVCGSSVNAANGKGFIVRNTSAGDPPAIARIAHMQIDYAGGHAVDITAGSDIDIGFPYIVGASGDGIRVGATINNREVRVTGGKSRGNVGYGINALGGIVLYSGNTDLQSNTSGMKSGPVRTELFGGGDVAHSVLDYGATGDGSTDDTAAIQAAINSVITTSGGALYFPNGTYKITSKLTIPLSYGWRIYGESREGAIIKQFTANTRIFSFETTNTHSFEIDHLSFSWNAAQPAANTQAIAIFFGTGTAGHTFYNWQVHHCNFNKGFRAIAADSANSPSIWGLTVSDCLFNNEMSGAAFFAFPSPSVGQPNIVIERCLLNAAVAAEELIILSAGDVVTLRNLEFLNGTAPVQLVLLSTCFSVTVMDCKSENYNAAAVGAALFRFNQSNVRAFNVNANGVLGTAGTSYVIRGDSTTTLSIFGMTASTLMSGGTLYAYTAGSLPYVGDIYLNPTGTGFASDNVFPVTAAAPKFDADKRQIDHHTFPGDTSPTLVAGSDKWQYFSTTLTANRTCTLPSISYVNQEFWIIRRATPAGAFTLTVVDPINGNNFVFPASINGFVRYRATSSTIWRIIDSGLDGGLRTLRVNASDMVPRTTGGCAALASVESTTNRVMTRVLDFDATTAEFAQFTWTPPKSWDEGTVQAQFIWQSTATGNVVWNIAGLALSDDDVLDTAFGTAVAVTDGVTATTDVMISAYTAAITIAGTPASEDMVTFQVSRDAANGSDTLAVDARLIAVRIKYTVNAADDS